MKAASNHLSKLTEGQVFKIKKELDEKRLISEKFGVTQSIISRIKLNKAWRCLSAKQVS